MRKLPPKIPIPKKGVLHWTKRYAEVGDELKVYPFFGISFVGRVTKVQRNNFGRISYALAGNRHAMTEELTPQHHKRCER